MDMVANEMACQQMYCALYMCLDPLSTLENGGLRNYV